jgi:putative (di)nucleoside polyphosphate hydrolase
MAQGGWVQAARGVTRGFNNHHTESVSGASSLSWSMPWHVKQSADIELTAIMTDFIDSQGFRANVGIVLMRDDQRVFVGGRPGGKGWQFPQGGIAAGEAPEQALFRELKEEVGLEPHEVEVLASTRGWLRYRLPKQYQRRTSGVACIGQKQRWFLLRFNGDDQRFRFDTTEQPEFDSWRWVDYWSPVRDVIFFKRAVYARALDELAQKAFTDAVPPLPEWWQDEKNLRAVARRRETGAA